jgi:hypothetical protein
MLPGLERVYTARFGLLDRLDGIPPGVYTAQVKFVHTETGQVLDTGSAAFQITVPYQPFPDLDPDTIVVVNYNNEVPYPIDARAKADLQVTFSTTDKVTGTVVLGRFKAEPARTPHAGDIADAGGLGKPGLKYWGIGVDGFSAGSAQVTGYYRDTELGAAQANTLFMGYLPSGAQRWMKLDNQGVFPNIQNTRGEIGVGALNLSPIIALASAPPVEVSGVQDTSLLGLLQQYWIVVGGIVLVLLIVPSLVLVLTRRRRA